MSVSHNFPSQKLSRGRAARVGRIAVILGAGLLLVGFLQPLRVIPIWNLPQQTQKN